MNSSKKKSPEEIRINGEYDRDAYNGENYSEKRLSLHKRQQTRKRSSLMPQEENDKNPTRDFIDWKDFNRIVSNNKAQPSPWEDSKDDSDENRLTEIWMGENFPEDVEEVPEEAPEDAEDAA